MDFYRALISYIILISFHPGQTLRCACKDDLRSCTSVYNLTADFETAQQICLENGGKLLTSSSKHIDSLLFNKMGHFWIDTEGDCVSKSKNSQGDSVTLNREMENVVCSSKCMTISSNGNLTERSCEESADGFLCDDIEWENCWENEASEVQILNDTECIQDTCEYECIDVPGGHMCYCSSMYRPRRGNPEHCEYQCYSNTCPLLNSMQKCPDGYIKEEMQCTDFDECLSNHNCEQECINTFGSFKCFCNVGFKLVNKSKCVPLTIDAPVTGAPSINYTYSQAAFETPVVYIGLTLFIILAISALFGLLYYLQKHKSDLLLKENNDPDNTTVQEGQLQLQNVLTS